MKSETIILTTDEEQCQKLISVLEKKHYHASLIRSLTDLERLLKSIQCSAIILDLDTISVDNRSIRELKTKNPEIYIIALSTRQLHPELEEAIPALKFKRSLQHHA
jgi:DNA-binding response OmpR family regulator